MKCVAPPTPLTPELCIDNTKRSCYRSCPRKYYWQHIRGLKPFFGSTALRFGTAWHGALEGFYQYIKENGWSEDGKAIHAGAEKAKTEWDKETAKQTFNEDYRTFEQCMTLFLQYVNHYSFDKGLLNIIATEQVFRCQMSLADDEAIAFPEIQAYPVALYFTGKIDLQVELNGINWMVEHKSTSQSLSTQTNRLNRTPQIKGYSWASDKVLSFRPEGSLISIAHCSSRKSPRTQEYGQVKMDFARTPQIFSQEDLAQWRVSFLATCNDIISDMRRGLWPMNEDACYQYGSCAYTPLCDQNRPLEDVNIDGFIVDFWDVEAE